MNHDEREALNAWMIEIEKLCERPGIGFSDREKLIKKARARRDQLLASPPQPIPIHLGGFDL